MGAPFGGELALEGLFEEGLAIDAELVARFFQGGLSGVEFAEELFNLRDNAALARQGKRRKAEGRNLINIDAGAITGVERIREGNKVHRIQAVFQE
ncbi:MAG: hypothetical protein KDM64_15570 [Verrucomicrobiae bacterium]|nr:hypothetical protein [Verrucomicrobiae bacterium]